jgi:hypothetical protein
LDSSAAIEFVCELVSNNFVNYFENILLPNNLIIARNNGDEEEDIEESFRGVEDQQGHPVQVGDQSNSKFRV